METNKEQRQVKTGDLKVACRASGQLSYATRSGIICGPLGITESLTHEGQCAVIHLETGGLICYSMSPKSAINTAQRLCQKFDPSFWEGVGNDAQRKAQLQLELTKILEQG
jgi:hypothetical protein